MFAAALKGPISQQLLKPRQPWQKMQYLLDNTSCGWFTERHVFVSHLKASKMNTGSVIFKEMEKKTKRYGIFVADTKHLMRSCDCIIKRMDAALRFIIQFEQELPRVIGQYQVSLPIQEFKVPFQNVYAAGYWWQLPGNANMEPRLHQRSIEYCGDLQKFKKATAC